MGVTKYWQLEQAERERWRDVVRWLYDKKGRRGLLGMGPFSSEFPSHGWR